MSVARKGHHAPGPGPWVRICMGRNQFQKQPHTSENGFYMYFPIWKFIHIWIFGYVETAPRHISRFQFWDVEKSAFLRILENVTIHDYKYLYMLMYSRKIEVFKCQYAHFAHIGLSFGCTDEKMDLGIYLDTYTCWPFSIIRQWWNSRNTAVPSLDTDGTAHKLLFHHWTLMEQRKNCCSIIGHWWNSAKNAVPSLGNDGTAEKRLFHHQTCMYVCMYVALCM